MNDCIEWGMARDKDGYGRKWSDGRLERAHRLAYVKHHDLPIRDIDGLMVIHSCDNPPCVNPDHLQLGSHADNMADMVAKGRQSRWSVSFGAKNGNAKLNEYAVRWIRSHHATGHYTQKELADMYGIKQPEVSAIVLRTRWGHVK